MKYWLLIIVVVIIAILPDASWPMENPSIRSPIISTTTPPSSISSGLIQSPNPIDTSGNLIITGNVIGGKHFRALMPYGSTTSFQAPIGSSSLDSFLRYSADLQDVGPYTDGYGPYYSPTGTVAIATPGQPGIFTPEMARTWARAGLPASSVSADQVALPAMPGGQATSDLDTSAVQMSLRPMSRTPQELEKIISDELSGALPPHEALRYLRTERLPLTQSGSEQYQDGTGKFQHSPLEVRTESTTAVPNDPLLTGRGLKPIDDRVPELRQRPAAETIYAERQDTPAAAGAGSPPRKWGPEGRTSLVHRPSSVVPAFPQTRPTLQDRQSASDGVIFPSDRAELEELIRVAEKKANALPQSGVPEVTTKLTEKQLHVYEQIKSRTNYLPAQKADSLSPWRLSTNSISAGLDDLIKPKAQDSRLKTQDLWHESDEAVSTTAKSVSVKTEGFGDDYSLGPNHPQAALEDATPTLGWTGSTRPVLGEHPQKRTASKDEFNWYMQAAELYLKQGRYYRAVDAYTMASIYKPGPAGSLREREAAGLAYVGKSHALFAAGEYIGSALFLSRALELDTRYSQLDSQAESKIKNRESLRLRSGQARIENQVFRFGSEVLGLLDKDELERRIADAEQRLKISDTAELQFLLGYIYYQLGRLDEAKNAIDAAYTAVTQVTARASSDEGGRMKDERLRMAVSAVKKAIDEAMAASQSTIK